MEGHDRYRTVLYDTPALEIVLDAMARRLVARLHDQQRVALVGVKRRGAPLADMLLARLQLQLPQCRIERLDLAIHRYADDLTLLHPDTQLTEQTEHEHMDLSDRVAVVVDDVLYRGFSLLKSVQYLVSKGVQTLHTAVLVDRHCAELPVHADVCGLTLQIAPGQVVECRVPPFEPAFQVVLVNPAAPSAARLPGT